MKASIIINSYNNWPLVRRAFRSALSQSMDRSQYEIIVVDDASTDLSKDLVPGFADDGAKVIMLKKNEGLANAINVAMRNIRGQYVARLDADDIMMPDFLKMMCYYLDWNKELDWLLCDHIIIDEHENEIGRSGEALACCHLFRTHAIESVGMYNPNLRINETSDLLIRLLQDERYRNHGGRINVPLYKWYRHEGSLTDGGRKGMI